MEENTNEETKLLEKRTIMFKGLPLTLLGDEIKVGDKAPNFKVIDNNMMPLKFHRTYKGKISVILSVPSLDTPVCDIETRKFNTEAQKLLNDIEVLAISMDLPFAQKRWCGAANVERVKTYSDYQKADFGKSYGVLIKELRLLSRAIFIVDREGIVKYVQMVPEVANEPDYDEVLSKLKELN